MVRRAINIASLFGHDHNYTLTALLQDLIISCWGSNPSLETCWPDFLLTRPPECWCTPSFMQSTNLFFIICHHSWNDINLTEDLFILLAWLLLKLRESEKKREKNTLFAFCMLFVSRTFTNDLYKYTIEVYLRSP